MRGVILLIGFAAGILFERLLRQGLPGQANRKEKPKVIRRIRVKHKDPESGIEYKDEYSYDETEAQGDDTSKAGEKGKPVAGKQLIGVAVQERDTNRTFVTNAAGAAVAPEAIACGGTYHVYRSGRVEKAESKCPDAETWKKLAAEVEAAVLKEAILVADTCRRKPSCNAELTFVASKRYCLGLVRLGDSPKDIEFFGCAYNAYHEVKVVCQSP